ncbi:hypothetical protein SNARM312S_05034 [Streptomyces narbonensis]
MAALLDELLPATVTGVRPEGDRVSEYRFEAGGETFRMVVSVRWIPAATMCVRGCARCAA